MLQQEKEFVAWGLSRLAVRNIVVFFILTLMTTVGVMGKVVWVLYKEGVEKDQAIVKCAQENAAKVETLLRENMEARASMQQILANQSKVDSNVREAKKTVQVITKKVKQR